MNEFRADLHCHTNYSDGSMSPEELIFHAKAIGLSGISITDHDSISAYPLAIPAAKKAQIWLGSGVEFSSMYEGVSIHLLGYDIDIENKELLALCQRHLDRRKQRNQAILNKLSKRGMQIDWDDLEEKVSKEHPIGRPHIALALLKKGYVSSVQEAFDKYIGDERSCFDPGIPISTDETIEVIHQAGGKAFLAHPHLMSQRKLILQLLEKPLDGIECYYSKCLPDQEKKWIKIAQQKGLLISGGSDFHGNIKPGVPLGASWVDWPTFEKIFEKNRWK